MFGSMFQRTLYFAAGGGSATVDEILGASLFLWHRADTYEPTGSPGGFGRWTDVSGNGRHSDAPSAAATPTETTVGGNAALNFDGTDDYLVSLATLADLRDFHDNTAKACCWVVVDADAGAGSKYVLATSGNGFTQTGFLIQNFDNAIRVDTLIANSSGSPYLQASSVAPGGPAIELTIAQTRLEGGELFQNVWTESTFSDSTSDTTASGAPDAGDSDFSLHIGRRPGVASWFDGRILEVIMAVGPTASQIASANNLLRSRYGTL